MYADRENAPSVVKKRYGNWRLTTTKTIGLKYKINNNLSHLLDRMELSEKCCAKIVYDIYNEIMRLQSVHTPMHKFFPQLENIEINLVNEEFQDAK